MTWDRFGLYFLPDPASARWARIATDWLGWDATRGAVCPSPATPGLDLDRITRVPRRYGLHATLKPPFRLAAGQSEQALHDACASFARGQAPVTLDGVSLTPLGRFLALTATGPTDDIERLAAAAVADLDAFRAPPDDAELARRRARPLSPEEEANLVRWGYPYVMDRFRFHLTLTDRLSPAEMGAATAVLTDLLVPHLPRPLTLDAVALVGEDTQGRFHRIAQFALTG